MKMTSLTKISPLIKGVCVVALASSMLLMTSCKSEKIPQTQEEITEFWHSGKTLPLEVGKLYPPLLLNLPNDNGYNIMLDVSHQCSFSMMWGQPGRMQSLGYRTVSNQASLDTVLDAKGHSRIRVPVDAKERIFPFAWYPNFEYDIVVTHQSASNGQKYLPEEQAALVEFVNNGGSLVIVGAHEGDQAKLDAWSMNDLAKKFGGEFTTQHDKAFNQGYAGLKVGDQWEVTAKGEKGLPVHAQRKFGKGKVVLLGGYAPFDEAHGDTDEAKERRENSKKLLADMLTWCAEGQAPVGGEPRFPQTMGGGGAIYPELEVGAGEIVVYYAKNQKDHLLKTVNETLPEATKQIENWLPSRRTAEPMYLILSAGDGGGWAVNAFKPKENGLISESAEGIVSIYGHELAHTMSGPDNDKGQTAGRSPMPHRGEAHAGWFQGKIDAWFDPKKLEQEARGCNGFFNDPKFLTFDLKQYTTDPEYGKANGFDNGKEWAKNWYIFQKLDDRYGNSWYPRWSWVQHTRWADDPERQLTWEESVEDMCIAVGEDLFPFFRKIGISLDRENVGDLTFQGKKMSFKPAPIEATPAGKVRIEPVLDYKKPIVVK